MWTLLGWLAIALSTVAVFDILGGNRTLAEKVMLIVFVVAFPLVGSTIYLTMLREKK